MDNTTKEKILEMACLCDGCLEKSYADDGCWDCENRGIYDGAMKMAEWKEQQMIDKAAEWLRFNYTEYLNNTRIGINIDEMVKDFKIDMKEE